VLYFQKDRRSQPRVCGIIYQQGNSPETIFCIKEITAKDQLIKVEYHNKALAIDPKYENALCNKGNALQICVPTGVIFIIQMHNHP
jgi:hypothetical protein